MSRSSPPRARGGQKPRYQHWQGGSLDSKLAADLLRTVMKITNMHGLGNDYVYVNGFAEQVADPAEVARKVSDRHFGIGSDGLILILPSGKDEVLMRMVNIEGSEGEMCGNGIRCVAKYTYDHGLSRNNPMRIETGRGVLTLDL